MFFVFVSTYILSAMVSLGYGSYRKLIKCVFWR
jgi:hypothetical protein